jgi:hypothetical protein
VTNLSPVSVTLTLSSVLQIDVGKVSYWVNFSGKSQHNTPRKHRIDVVLTHATLSLISLQAALCTLSIIIILLYRIIFTICRSMFFVVLNISSRPQNMNELEVFFRDMLTHPSVLLTTSFLWIRETIINEEELTVISEQSS